MFLCIKNPGEAPIEGYLLLGVSTTRDCGVSGTIGQFGSGAKHAINVLLRAGLRTVIYCGLTRLEFFTRDDEVNDGLVRKPIKRVLCKLGGTSTKTVDTGWVLDFGALDWTDVAMALREFVSNAIDRTIRQQNDFLPALLDSNLSVTTVEENQLKAKAGYTKVYIEMNDQVMRYFGELPRRFLHFSSRPEQVKQVLLPKAARNLNGKQTAVIYREGVFIREIEETTAPSIYDYNFRAPQLPIDESRNSSEYAVKAAAARLLRKATAEELVPIFKSLVDQEESFEAAFDPDYICSSWDKPAPEQQETWQRAWQAVAGDSVLCGPSATIAEFVQRKGYNVKTIKSDNMVMAARRFGIPTDAKVLSSYEQKGCEKLPPTPAAIAAVDTIWEWLKLTDLTKGKEKPPVGCFRDVMEGGTRNLGFRDKDGVYFANDHVSGGVTKMVLKTALEECVHWVTEATDSSRDFQDLVLRMVVELAS